MYSTYLKYKLYMKKNYNKEIEYEKYLTHKRVRSKTYKRFLYDLSKWN